MSARPAPSAASHTTLLAAGISILAVCPASLAVLPSHVGVWFGLGFAGAAGTALIHAGLQRAPWARFRAKPAQDEDAVPTPAQARLLDDVEHELRTPLTALMLVGENALATLGPDAGAREAIVSMLEEAQHMREMLHQLLTLSRCSSPNFADAHFTLEDASELARECTETLAALAEAKGQNISLSLEQPLPVRARRALLRQAVMNLVHNAIEHCPEGVRITVWARPDRLGRAAISVQDNGPGIAAEHQQRVFRRFDRGDAARRTGGSRGLGLSNALLIARCHGGTIDLRSTPGQGSRFTLRLPLAEEQEPSTPRATAVAA